MSSPIFVNVLLTNGEMLSQQFACDVTIDEVKRSMLELQNGGGTPLSSSQLAGWRLSTPQGKTLEFEFGQLATASLEIKTELDSTNRTTLHLRPNPNGAAPRPPMSRELPKAPSRVVVTPLKKSADDMTPSSPNSSSSSSSATASVDPMLSPRASMSSGSAASAGVGPFRRLPGGSSRRAPRAATMALSSEASMGGSGNGGGGGGGGANYDMPRVSSGGFTSSESEHAQRSLSNNGAYNNNNADDSSSSSSTSTSPTMMMNSGTASAGVVVQAPQLPKQRPMPVPRGPSATLDKVRRVFLFLTNLNFDSLSFF